MESAFSSGGTIIGKILGRDGIAFADRKSKFNGGKKLANIALPLPLHQSLHGKRRDFLVDAEQGVHPVGNEKGNIFLMLRKGR